jgi:hypothetical protein
VRNSAICFLDGWLLGVQDIQERPGKGNKAIERTVISTFQVAQSLGFNGDFRAWEHLLRVHE